MADPITSRVIGERFSDATWVGDISDTVQPIKRVRLSASSRSDSSAVAVAIK